MKFLFFICVLVGNVLWCQNRALKRLPDLRFDEIVHGEKRDVGHWGDNSIYVLDFWGTWCSPCIKNIPELNQLQLKYKNDHLKIIAYSFEPVEKVRNFISKNNMDFEYVLVNEEGKSYVNQLGNNGFLQGFPYSFLIDKKGNVAWHGNPKDGLEDAIIRLLKN